MTRSLLSLADLDAKEVLTVLTLSAEYKRAIRTQHPLSVLTHRVLGLLFEKPSTRTRTGFETAVLRMGGNALYLPSDHLQASRGEPMKDTARVLGSYLDGIIARVYAHDALLQLQKFSGIPIINGLSDLEHPTQVLSDLLTIQEEKKRLAGLTLTFIGDGNNVCNSLLLGAALTGMHMRVACPKGYEPDGEVLRKARKIARQTASRLSIVRSPEEAARDADILYTDTWISMGHEKEQETRLRIFQQYQINAPLLEIAGSEARVMHCLPAHRGYEITEDVLEGPRSLVWPQAENKLYGAAGVLGFLFSREG